MKLHIDRPGASHRIRAYDHEHVRVGEISYRGNIVLTPDMILTDALPSAFSELTATHLQILMELNPEVVLMGCGDHQQFLAPDLQRQLLMAKIGVEVMTTAAVCRTFNVLAADERRVVAVLFFTADPASARRP